MREEELLEHALQQFSQDGFRETSLQDIADRLGITRPLFYYYFESKEDLLWRIIGRLGDDLRSESQPLAQSDASAIERVELILQAHLATLLNNPAAFRVYFAERHLVDGKRDRSLKRGETEYLNLIIDVIEQGQREGDICDVDAKILAHLGMGLANSTLRWYVPDGPISCEELVKTTTSVFVDGILTPQGRARKAEKGTINVSTAKTHVK